MPQTVNVAHFRLVHSHRMFVAAYPRETQEMAFDAHNRAFAFFGGVPLRMVYDNLKAVVQTILSDKERQFNPRFMALANHYLFEPVACTPASGWGEAASHKACFVLRRPDWPVGQSAGRGVKARSRIRSAISAIACSLPSPALPVWLN